MSSMWRAAVILPSARWRRPRFELGTICGAGRILLQLRASCSERRLRAQSVAPASPEQRLQFRRLCALPDRLSRLAGGNRRCAAGPRKRCGRERMPLRSSPSSPTTSRRPATAGRGLPTLLPQAVVSADALDAARNAWASADLGVTDEQAIWSRYGGSFTRADHDRRADALLFAKRPSDAARFLTADSPQRQAAFAARIAMQRAPPMQIARYADSHRDGHQRRRADDGPRALPTRQQLRSAAAQHLAARAHNFTLPAGRSRTLLRDDAPARGRRGTGPAMADRLSISRSQLDDVLPAGSAGQPTSRSGSATITPASPGSPATSRSTGSTSPSSAVAMFDRYARARPLAAGPDEGQLLGRTRRACRPDSFQIANGYFQRAAAYPELFYGQLALERLGRSVPPPPQRCRNM